MVSGNLQDEIRGLKVDPCRLELLFPNRRDSEIVPTACRMLEQPLMITRRWASQFWDWAEIRREAESYRRMERRNSGQ